MVLIIGAYFLGQTSARTAPPVAQTSIRPTPTVPVQAAHGVISTDNSAEIQHLQARIADCQNEIYAADDSIWQANFNLVQARSGATPYSSLQTQKQVDDLLDSVGGNTLCFEDGTAQYNQSNTLNTSQQQSSLMTP
jgi:hypothetical protein